MAYSYNFLLHLIGFGFVSAIVIAALVLNRKLCTEQDLEKKMYLSGIMRTFAMFGHITVTVLLLTGVGNMVNRYGMGAPWPHETWLTVKIGLFVLLAAISLSVSPRLAVKRATLIKSMAEKSGPDDIEKRIAKQDKVITMVLYFQTALLLAIVILSAFGSGKHPGTF